MIKALAIIPLLVSATFAQTSVSWVTLFFLITIPNLESRRRQLLELLPRAR